MQQTPSGSALAKAPTGIEGLDALTQGGLLRGRPTLICGGAGCGKTQLATEFLVRGAAQFGEPGVLVACEKTADELADRVRSLGHDLDALIQRGLLLVDPVRVERSEVTETGAYDLDGLFIRLAHAIATLGAKRVVVDAIESLFAGFVNEAVLRTELRRLVHWLEDQRVTAILTGGRGEGSLGDGLEEYISGGVIVLDRDPGEGTARFTSLSRDRASVPHAERQHAELGLRLAAVDAQLAAVQAQLDAVERTCRQAGAPRPPDGAGRG